jgi:hypothetical protein
LDIQYTFLNKRRHQDVEGNQGQKCIGNITKAPGSKIFYIFLNQGSLGSMVGRTIGDIGKASKSCFYTIRGAQKNNHGCLKY